MSPIGMLLYGYCISISILGLLYYCNREYLSTTTEIAEGNRGKEALIVIVTLIIVGVLLIVALLRCCLALCFFRAQIENQ